MKVKIHSTTDLITNSSTVIFTYSEGSEGSLKEMVNEIFKTFNINKTYDEVFNTVVLCEDEYLYGEYIENLEDDGDDLPEGITEETDISKLVDDVKSGKLEKPKWFNDVEEKDNHCDYFRASTTLHIIPKLAEYQKLADLIQIFLYSTSHEATRDG